MSTRVLLWVMSSFLQVTWIERIYDRLVDRNAAKPLATVDRYDVLGWALFTGGALPGTSFYSGCLAAWAMTARFRDYLLTRLLSRLPSCCCRGHGRRCLGERGLSLHL